MRQQLAGVEGANIQRNADLLAVTFKSDLLFDTNSAILKAGALTEISALPRFCSSIRRRISVLPALPTAPAPRFTISSFPSGVPRRYRMPWQRRESIRAAW